MFIPVILSGGAGTRLWPVSRELHPKPFMRVGNGQSLLQKTFNRVAKLNSVAEVLTVTNREFYFKTKEEYALLKSTVKNSFLLEPCSRNTAPAIAMAALYAREKYGTESVLLILPADHLIEEQDQFNEIAEHAYKIAKTNKLVTLGIKPTLPETGFGYIKLDKAYSNDAFHVEKFVEKPSVVHAQEYLDSGQYLWNSGMFCFKVDVILNQFEKHSPQIYQSANHCWQNSRNAENTLPDTIEIDPHTFQHSEDLSIDYAIMEKAQDVVVIPCEFGWSDIGSWNGVSDLVPPDNSGNRVIGETLTIDVTNSFIQSNDRLVAAIGVDNLIIVDTPDALLIADRHRSQDVKKVVSQLKQSNHDSYKIHRTVARPWGTFTTLEESKGFKIKRIVVKPGASLSLQMHHHRSEHWVVVSGVAKVTNGSEHFTLNTNESTFIPAGHQHRLENPGLIELVLIEVQTGEYLGEDDIVRFDDKYGRA